jgi:DNA polymerase V
MEITTAASGFPSPADDYIETTLDLNELLVKKPAATYFVRAQGDSMLTAGIHSCDILIVDRSLIPASGKVVVCVLDGGLTVKRLVRDNEQWKLTSENHPDIIVEGDVELMIWGVVTSIVRQL